MYIKDPDIYNIKTKRYRLEITKYRRMLGTNIIDGQKSYRKRIKYELKESLYSSSVGETCIKNSLILSIIKPDFRWVIHK